MMACESGWTKQAADFAPKLKRTAALNAATAVLNVLIAGLKRSANRIR